MTYANLTLTIYFHNELRSVLQEEFSLNLFVILCSEF